MLRAIFFDALPQQRQKKSLCMRFGMAKRRLNISQRFILYFNRSSNRPSSSSGCHFRLSLPSKARDLHDTVVVVVVCRSGNMMSQQLSDGDGDPDGVGLAPPRLRDVRHTADQVLQRG